MRLALIALLIAVHLAHTADARPVQMLRSHDRAMSVLAAVRDNRRLPSLDGSRTLTMHFKYSPLSRPRADGSLQLQFASGRYLRREHLPWQAFPASEVELGEETFRRTYSNGTKTLVSPPAAEGNARAAAVIDYLGLLHEVPPWAKVRLSCPPGDSGQRPPACSEVVLASTDSMRIELHFDPMAGLLASVRQIHGTKNSGTDSVIVVTEYSSYTAYGGRLFASRMTRRITSGPPNMVGHGFEAVLESAVFD